MKGVSSFQTPYPWLSDTNVTDAWIAEKDYMTIATGVSNWAPHKGTINLVQATGANQPIYSSNSWNKGIGSLSFNGTSQFFTGNSLASKVNGLNIPFTTIIALQLNSTVTGQVPYYFTDTSNTVRFEGLQTFTSSGVKWGSFRNDGTTTISGVVTSSAPTTNRIIITTIFTGTTLTVRFNGVTTNVNGLTANTNSVTLSKFTLGAFVAATTSAWMNGKIRAFIFGANAFPVATYTAIENYLLSEA